MTQEKRMDAVENPQTSTKYASYIQDNVLGTLRNSRPGLCPHRSWNLWQRKGIMTSQISI